MIERRIVETVSINGVVKKLTCAVDAISDGVRVDSVQADYQLPPPPANGAVDYVDLTADVSMSWVPVSFWGGLEEKLQDRMKAPKVERGLPWKPEPITPEAEATKAAPSVTPYDDTALQDRLRECETANARMVKLIDDLSSRLAVLEGRKPVGPSPELLAEKREDESLSAFRDRLNGELIRLYGMQDYHKSGGEAMPDGERHRMKYLEGQVWLKASGDG